MARMNSAPVMAIHYRAKMPDVNQPAPEVKIHRFRPLWCARRGVS
jgi:hypothetical protein